MVEPRSERVTAEDREQPGGVAGSIAEAGLDERTDVVFTDHDAPGIAELLGEVLRSPARFVGVMGSRRHVGPYLDDLRARGFGDDAIGRIRSPVGLDLGGRRPDEIALSIAAGIVAARHGRGGGWLDEP
jgi:xanthine/CO dehydrogenase XdhC/CoxF family maturation factor